jgi:hypothetical protein
MLQRKAGKKGLQNRGPARFEVKEFYPNKGKRSVTKTLQMINSG